jgi:long-chain acyl-CoA synthetase
MEVVPVDLVAIGMLIAGIMLLNGQAERVYQLSTADVNPIYYGPLIRILHDEYRRQRSVKKNGGFHFPALPTSVHVLTPEESRLRGQRQQLTISRLQQWVTALRRLMEHSGIPGARRFRRLTTQLRQTGLKVMIRDQALELYQPFMHDNRFIFENENMRSAYSKLSENDRELLPWIPEQIDWRDYWVNQEIAGVQKWVQTETSFRV